MVEVFFMLSGFCMTLGYFNRVAGHEIPFLEFISKRLKKCYPLLVVTTLLMTCLTFIYQLKTGTTYVFQNFDLSHFFSAIFLLQEGILGTEPSFNAVAWFLSPLFTCYCLFYFLAYHCNEREKSDFCFLLLSLLGMAMLLSMLDFPILNRKLARGVSCFFLGALIEEVYEHENHMDTKRLGYTSLVMLAVSYLIFRLVGNSCFGNPNMVAILEIAPFSIMTALFVPSVKCLLSTRIISFLGKISFEVFMLHFPFQLLIKICDISFLLHLDFLSKKIWIMYVVGTLFVASFYHYRMKDRIDDFVMGFFRIHWMKEK